MQRDRGSRCGALGAAAQRQRGRSCGRARRALRRLQLLHGIAAQLIQHRTRGEGRAGDFQLDFRQFVRRVAQAAELGAQVLFVDGAIARRAQRARRFPRSRSRRPRSTRCAAVRLRAPSRALRPAACGAATPASVYTRAALSRSGSCVRHTRSPGRMRSRWISAVAEAQFAALDLEDAPAFFRLLGTAPIGGIEDHAVAGLERRRRGAPRRAR